MNVSDLDRLFRGARSSDPHAYECRVKLRTADGVHRPGPQGFCLNCGWRFPDWKAPISGDHRREKR